MTLSVCMIVRDESSVIARSIKCVSTLADEVIVVDTGSSDNSAQIAAGLGAKVYSFAWQDDFSLARNYSFSLASCDYIMWLDADDVIEETDAQAIRALVAAGNFDVAMLRYQSGNLSYYRERILKRSCNFLWQGAVHEVIVPRGKVIYSSARVIHAKQSQGVPLRNLIIYQKQIARGIPLDERQKFYYGRELYYNGMPLQAIAVLEQFLLGDGWVVNKAEACRTLYFCYIRTGNIDAAFKSLVRAFLYMSPRAQDCCILASHFFEKGQYDSAGYWYLRAIDCPEREEDGGFVDGEYSSFIPAINLAVVCDKLGDYVSANEWNERAGAIRPDDPAYLQNRRYFARRLSGG